MKATLSLKLVPNDPEYAARIYKDLLDQRKAITQEMTPLRTVLEAAALSAGGTLDLQTVSVSVCEVSREGISVKEAKAKLGHLLTPFVKVTVYTQMRVSRKESGIGTIWNRIPPRQFY